MKIRLLTFSCLMLVLLAAWFLSFGAQAIGAEVPNPRPTPTPDAPLPPGPLVLPDTPPLPDLIVTSIEVEPGTPAINEPAIIRVTIANVGTRDVQPGNNFYVDLYIDPSVVPIQLGQDGEYAWGAQGYWLPKGASYTLFTTWTFNDVKSYSLYAQVDTDGTVAEENENNNVTGPVEVTVAAPDKVAYQSHESFQLGMASNLDISHPSGVIRRGIFAEPSSEPDVYQPDDMINDITGTISGGAVLPTTVNQIHPFMLGDGENRMFAIWEDGRNGGVFNRDIYFSRSDDLGQTWGPDIRVNDDPIGNTVNQVSPALAYDAVNDRLYAAWQDGRGGNYNIYVAYSTNGGSTWSTNVRINDDLGTAAQMNPVISVEPLLSPNVYVVWQDKRNGNDDIYLARSGNLGVTWSENTFVTDDPGITLQDQAAPAIDIDTFGVVYVCWEDWRDPVHPDIYCSRSWDEGLTFGIDVPVTYPEQGTSYRVEPSMVVSLTRTMEEEIIVPGEITTWVPITITNIHVAWQEGQGDEADIYYAYAIYDWTDPEMCPYPYDFCFKSPLRVDGFVIDSQYALPADPRPIWDIESSWQGQVSLTPAAQRDWTYCHASSDVTYSLGVYVAWADAASYDDWRYEIQTRRIASPMGQGKSFETCEDHNTGVLNDNAKLYAYRDNIDIYRLFQPAATRQANPSIWAALPEYPTFAVPIYVAWDDDRWDKPLDPSTVRNRDVFMAKTRFGYDVGIFISPVIDGRGVSKWFALSWWGATEHYGDLLFQTRFGTTAYPPQSDVAANGWTRWTGNPSSTYLGCTAGTGCYYDAPGRHIVGPSGTDWPDYRYIQYKVIITGYDRLTAVSQVILHYKGPNVIFVPVVHKDF